MNKDRSAISSDQVTDIPPELLFSEAITRIVFCESLKRADPKIHVGCGDIFKPRKRSSFA